MRDYRDYYRNNLKEYPHVVNTECFKISKLSPKKFQDEYPNLMFVEVPIGNFMYWMFRSIEDRDTFLDWMHRKKV